MKPAPLIEPAAQVLQGRVAVITGAASGIGRASALLFARHGATVVCIDIQDEPGSAVAREIGAAGGKALYLHADVRDIAQLQAAATACAAQLPRVDILFNNAGRVLRRSFEETDAAGWADMLRTNLDSVFLCSQAFLPLLKQSPCGSIINHASVDATLGNPTIAAYSAAKGGVVPFTHVMAHDLGKYGIRVNTLSTGNIPTALSGPGQENAANARTAVTPLKRPGRPEEAAHAALFLASDWASFVNGINLVVDGGRTGITQGCFDP